MKQKEKLHTIKSMKYKKIREFDDKHDVFEALALLLLVENMEKQQTISSQKRKKNYILEKKKKIYKHQKKIRKMQEEIYICGKEWLFNCKVHQRNAKHEKQIWKFMMRDDERRVSNEGQTSVKRRKKMKQNEYEKGRGERERERGREKEEKEERKKRT